MERRCFVRQPAPATNPLPFTPAVTATNRYGKYRSLFGNSAGSALGRQTADNGGRLLPLPLPIDMVRFAHGLGGLMQAFLAYEFLRAIRKVPARQGWRNIDSQAQRALIFSIRRAGVYQCLFQTFKAYYRTMMALYHGGFAIPVGLAEITGYDNSILFCTLHGAIPKCETQREPWRKSRLFVILGLV